MVTKIAKLMCYTVLFWVADQGVFRPVPWCWG